MRWKMWWCAVVALQLATAGFFGVEGFLMPYGLWQIPSPPNSEVPAAQWSALSSLGVAVTMNFFSTQSPVLNGFNMTGGQLLWSTTKSLCMTPLFVDILGLDNAGQFAVGCADRVQLYSAATGEWSHDVMLPRDLTPVSYVTPAAAAAPGLLAQFTQQLLPNTWAISVQNSSYTPPIKASLLWNTLPPAPQFLYLVNCNGETAPVAPVSDGRTGMFQVCVGPAQQPLAMYRSTQNEHLGWVISLPYIAREVHVFANTSNFLNPIGIFVVRDVSGAVHVASYTSTAITPQWSVTLPYVLPPQAGSLQGALVGNAFLVWLPAGGGLYCFSGSGTQMWWSSKGATVLGIVAAETVEAAVVVASDAIIKYRVADGHLVFYAPLEVPLSLETPAFVDVIKVIRMEAPMRSAWSNLGPDIPALLVASGGASHIHRLDSGQRMGFMDVSLHGTSATLTSAPTFFPPPSWTSGRGMSVAYTAPSGIVAYSVVCGWYEPATMAVAQQQVAFKYHAGEGVVSAISRNHDVVWNVSVSNGGSSWGSSTSVDGETLVSMAPLSFNMLVCVNNAGQFTVIDTFSGNVLATLRLPSACGVDGTDATVLPSALVGGGGVDTPLFLTANLPCLIVLYANLSITTVALPWRTALPPTVDTINGVVILQTQHQLFAASWAGQTRSPLAWPLASFQDEILGVVPSTTFLQVPSPIVYVFTSESVTAVNLDGEGDARVWVLMQARLSAWTFYNSSLFTVSQQGICSISLDPTLSLRLLWCHGALAFDEAYVVSPMTVTPDGVLLVALDNHLYAIDTVSAAPRWNTLGYLTLPEGDCTSITFVESAYAVGIVCQGTLYLVDATGPPHALILFVSDVGQNAQLDAAPPALFAVGGGAVVSVPLPSSLLWPASSQPAAITVPPQVETAAPGATPAPVPTPAYVPDYPNAASVPPAYTILDVFSESAESTSASIASSLFPNVVFVSPITRNGSCVVSQVSSTARLYMWATEFQPAPQCVCSRPLLSVSGTSAANAYLTVLCDGVVGVFQASSGTLLWSTTSPSIVCSPIRVYTHATTFVAANGQVAVVLVGLETVCILNATNGALLFQKSVAYTLAMTKLVQQVTGSPATNLTVAVSSGSNLVVLSVPLSNVAAATLLFSGNLALAPYNCYTAVFLPKFVNGSAPSNPSCVCLTASGHAQLFSLTGLSQRPPTETDAHIAYTSRMLSSNATALITAYYDEYSALVLGTTAGVWYLAPGNPTPVVVPVSSEDYLCSAASRTVYVFAAQTGMLSAFDITTRLTLWTTNTSTTVYTTPLYDDPFPVVEVATQDFVVLGVSGMLALNTSNGALLWQAHQANGGLVRALLPTTADVAVDEGESLLALYHYTESSSAFAAYAPSSWVDNPPCFYGQSFAIANASNPNIALVASTEVVVAGPVEGFTVLTDLTSWITVAEEMPLLAIGTDASTQRRVAVVTLPSIVMLTDMVTGNELAVLFQSDACPEAAGLGATMSLETAAVQAGDVILLLDAVCLYVVNVTAKTLTATFLSSSITFSPQSVQLVGGAEQQLLAVITSPEGTAAAVDIRACELLWLNDYFHVYSPTGWSSLGVLAPYYDPAIPLSERQLVFTSLSLAAGVSLSTGELLWLTSLEPYALYTVPMVVVATSYGEVLIVDSGVALIVSLQMTVQSGRVQRVELPLFADQMPTSAVNVDGSSIVVVSFGSTVAGLVASTAAVLWTTTLVNYTESGFTAASLVPVPDGPPPMVLLSGCGTALFSTATGKVYYQFEENVALPAQFGTAGAPLSFAIFGGYSYEQCVMELLFPAAYAVPPAVSPVSAPVIPNNYVFVPPLLPTATAPAASPGVPAPILTWQVNPGAQFAMNIPSSITTNLLLGGKGIVLLNFNGSSWTDYVSQIQLVDARTGRVIVTDTIPKEECDAQLLIGLSGTYGGIVCANEIVKVQADQSVLSIFDLSTMSFDVTVNVLLPSGLDYSGATVVPLSPQEAASTACLVSSLASRAQLICLSVDHLPGAASIVFNMSCPRASSHFLQIPTAVPGGLLVVSCGGDGTTSLMGVAVATGAVMWTEDFPDTHVLSIANTQVALAVQQGKRWGVSVLSSATGALEEIIAASNVASAAAVLLLSATCPSTPYTVAVLDTGVVPNQLWLLSNTSSKAVPLANFAQLLTTCAACSVVAVSMMANTVTVTTLSATTQSQPLSLQVTLAGSDTPNSATCFADGTAVLVAMDNSVVYVDYNSSRALQLAVAPLANNGIVGVPTNGGTVPVSEQLVDVVGQDGTISQFVLSAAASETVAVTHFAVLNDTLVLGSIGNTSYLFNVSPTNGTLTALWGVQLESMTPYHVFDPALFLSVGQLQGVSVIVRSSSDRTVFGFRADSGQLLFQNELPLCNGDGAQVGEVASVADTFNDVLHVVVGNACLYSVGAGSGDIVVHVSEAVLHPSLTLGTLCLLTIDTFGVVTCRDRATLQVSWTASFGVVLLSAGVTVSYYGGLFVLGLPGSVVCLEESSGAVAWEAPIPAASTVAVSPLGVVIVASSSGGVSALALDPVVGSRVLWVSSSLLSLDNEGGRDIDSETADLSLKSARPPPPIFPVNGIVVAAAADQLVAYDVLSGTVAFTQQTSAPCTALLSAPLTATPPLSNLFFATCGNVDIRSVVTGARLGVLGKPPSTGLQGCGAVPLQLTPLSQTLVFCNSQNAMDAQPIPQFIAAAAPEAPVIVTPSSTHPPYGTLPPNFVPDGLPTPAPTFAGDSAFPHLACVLNINLNLPSLASCLVAALNASYGTSVSPRCVPLGSNITDCVWTWVRSCVCQGAMIYLNTVLQSLVESGPLDLCRAGATRSCAEGNDAKSDVCSELFLVNASAGTVFPPQLISELPSPANALVSFVPPSPPSPQGAPPKAGLSAGGVVGIVVCVVVAATAVAVVVRHHVNRRKWSSLSSSLSGGGGADHGEDELTSMRNIGTANLQRGSGYATL